MQQNCSVITARDSLWQGLFISEEITAFTLKSSSMSTMTDQLSLSCIWVTPWLRMKLCYSSSKLWKFTCMNMFSDINSFEKPKGVLVEWVGLGGQTSWIFNSCLYLLATWSWMLGKLHNSLCLNSPHLNNEDDYRVIVRIKCEVENFKNAQPSEGSYKIFFYYLILKCSWTPSWSLSLSLSYLIGKC